MVVMKKLSDIKPDTRFRLNNTEGFFRLDGGDILLEKKYVGTSCLIRCAHYFSRGSDHYRRGGYYFPSSMIVRILSEGQ